jgi:benzil reductase ((S)-benzoin forming)
MDYYLITGVSRGIGAALAQRLIQPGNTLCVASRTLNEDLTDLASSLEVPIFYTETDLSAPGSATAFITEVFRNIHPGDDDRIALINNAGMLEPIALLESVDEVQAEEHLRLNLLAPVMLSSAFLRLTAGSRSERVILNISSGAAYIPFRGWSVYCSSKAGLDMLTRVSGLEQKDQPNPAKIFSLAPGIVDTKMQELIRQTRETDFPDRETFRKLHEEGNLSDPKSLADLIAPGLFCREIQTGAVLTLDEFKEICCKDGN